MLRRHRSTLLDPAQRDRGATAAEYALIASLIAVVIVGAVALLGTSLSERWDDSASSVGAVTNP